MHRRAGAPQRWLCVQGSEGSLHFTLGLSFPILTRRSVPARVPHRAMVRNRGGPMGRGAALKEGLMWLWGLQP